MKKLFRFALVAFAFVALTACSNTQPISSVNQAPVATDLTKEQVRLAIVQATTRRGWVVEEDDGAEIIASINVRSHQARVRIPYSENSYSIHYVDSVNLKHRNDKIHRNYNRWVYNLNSDIRKQMSLAMTQ